MLNNLCHLESMCPALGFSKAFRCLTVNALQVLCLADCRQILPAGGVDNSHWWVFSTNKVSVVWAVWSAAALKHLEAEEPQCSWKKGSNCFYVYVSCKHIAHVHQDGNGEMTSSSSFNPGEPTKLNLIF